MIRTKLRTLILENYLFTDDDGELDDDQSFLDTAILDSMGILEVISFMSEELGVVVDEDEMVPENLDSINRLLAFIEKKKALA